MSLLDYEIMTRLRLFPILRRVAVKTRQTAFLDVFQKNRMTMYMHTYVDRKYE